MLESETLLYVYNSDSYILWVEGYLMIGPKIHGGNHLEFLLRVLPSNRWKNTGQWPASQYWLMF